MARCLVIGGNGFLGSYLVDELVSNGHDVTVFDRFSAPVQFEAKRTSSIKGDFFDKHQLAESLKGQEIVFHFLSSTTPASAENDPSADLKLNIAGSVELFKIATESQVKRLCFASTGGAIYGDQQLQKYSESNLTLPVSPYAIGKLAIEGYLRYFRVRHGLNSATFRISNPFGPRQHQNRAQGVIPIFLNQIADGIPVTLFGDGSMVRDYIYAPDVAKMIAATVDFELKHDTYNIGTGVGTSVSEILDVIRIVTGKEFETRQLPRPSTFIQESVLDISRYQSEFGVSSSILLRDGIEATWKTIIGKDSRA